MKKNCRNCKWAAWSKASNGRRLFGNWAECSYPVELIALPLGRSDAAQLLQRKASVRSYENNELACPTWEREEKKVTP